MPGLVEVMPTSAERWSDANSHEYAALPSEGTFKSWAKAVGFGAYKHTGLMRAHEALRRWRYPPHVSVFLFHRVTDQIPPDGLTVSTAWFREFCRRMKSSYRVLTLAEIEGLGRTGEAPPPRSVAITFDDCYADNFAAAEVLHEHGLPATFFVPTRFVGTTERFSWDADLPPMPNLTWDAVRRMVSLGHDIGSHSVTHPDFGQLNEREAMQELTESRRVLDEQLGVAPRWFAFPFGGSANFREEQIELIARAGYVGSFSAVVGFVEPTVLGAGITRKILPRVAVPYFRDLNQLELYSNRCLDWAYALKRKIVNKTATG